MHEDDEIDMEEVGEDGNEEEWYEIIRYSRLPIQAILYVLNDHIANMYRKCVKH